MSSSTPPSEPEQVRPRPKYGEYADPNNPAQLLILPLAAAVPEPEKVLPPRPQYGEYADTQTPSTLLDPTQPLPAPSAHFSGLAIYALLLSWIFSPLGLIFGIIAVHQIRSTKAIGLGMAIAAIVISSANIIFNIVYLLTATSK